MIYDIHVHVAGLSPIPPNNRPQPLAGRGFLLRCFARRLSAPLGTDPTVEQIDRMKQRFLSWIETSTVDRMVVLALDGAHHPDGTPDWGNTILMSTNSEVADLVSMHRKLLFGASIHPARPDTLSEIDHVVKRGACLVKWIPSAQNICPDDPVCIPFYEAIAHHGLPLLVHTGNEHTLRRFHNTLNDPRRLTTALDRGVTVIAAHCGTRLFLHEKTYFSHWKRMALEYERFFGDLSAFALPLHGGPLKDILGCQTLLSKVLYGSDFPAITAPFWHLPKLGLGPVLRLSRTENPFDNTYLTMKELGVPDEVFKRAKAVLKLRNDRASPNPLTTEL